MNLPTILKGLIRLSGVAALVLGLAFWFGYAGSFIRLHMVLGIFLVLSLWALGGIAWWEGVRRDLISSVVVWGVVIWVFGVTQDQVLPGGLHWLVEVGHLVAGGIAIVLGIVLGNAVVNRRAVERSSLS